MNPLAVLVGGAQQVFSQAPLASLGRARVPVIAMIVMIIIAIILAPGVVANSRVTETNKQMIDRTDILLTHSDRVTGAVNSLTADVSKLNGTRVSSWLPSASWEKPKSDFRGKDGFTPSAYTAELEFFKTLPATEQFVYLNMSRDEKRAKYSALKTS